MKFLLLMMILPLYSQSQVSSESFVVQIHEGKYQVLSPDKKKNIFSVIIENKSLSDQVGKFIIGTKTLKYVSIRSGKSETVEVENKSSDIVSFIPLSPSFQEVPLQFGKKAYEIPSKE